MDLTDDAFDEELNGYFLSVYYYIIIEKQELVTQDFIEDFRTCVQRKLYRSMGTGKKSLASRYRVNKIEKY